MSALTHACGRIIPAVPTPAELDRLRVVLVATRNPLNIGAAARAMSNFGFFNLTLVNPYDPSYREARSAVGASDLLANAHRVDTVAEAVSGCTLVIGTTAAGAQRELRHPLLRLEQAASRIRKHLQSGHAAILFGSEKFGLSNDDLSHCHYLLRIPTREQHRSVNLGQSVAICLYELARDAKSKSPAPPARAGNTKSQTTALSSRAGGAAQPANKPATSATQPLHQPATSADIERVADLLMQALDASGSLQVRSESGTRAKVRRLLLRHKLSTADAEFWLGMLRQITWKLSGPANPSAKPKPRT